MNLPAMLEHQTGFTDVQSPTPTGTFGETEGHSNFDEQAGSDALALRQHLGERIDFDVVEGRDETDIPVNLAIPGRLGPSGPRVKKFRQWSWATRPEVGWADRLTATLLDASIWDRLVPQTPERALARWFTAKRLAQEEPNPLKASSTEDANRSTEDTDRLLALLADAPSRLRNQIHAMLVRFCSPDEILDASLARYEQTCQERYLLQAISLLESKGKDAWRALRTLARSNRRECELFIGLIARCNSVPASERASAIKRLAASPHVDVRSALVDQLPEFDEEAQRCALEVLKGDADLEIRQEAEEYLAELE